MTNSFGADRDTRDLFSAIDANDAAAFVGFLTDDAVFRFGSAPGVTGREAIQEAVTGFFGSIAGCLHNVTNTLASSSTLVCEGEVTYRRLNGSDVTLPFTDVLEYDGELISHYKIYMDISPLYSD